MEEDGGGFIFWEASDISLLFVQAVKEAYEFTKKLKLL